MRRPLVIGGSVLILVVVTGLVLFSRTSAPRPQKMQKDTHSAEDSALDSAREILSKANSAQVCREAIHKLNSQLDRNPEHPIQRLAHPELLQKRLGLEADELAEVNSGLFTLLDAHHLDLCLLLREAARSLEVEGQPPLEQAKTAFAWVIRQVRLQQPEQPGPMSPPQFVLRRGWGASEERAVLFLELLRQFDVQGCMIAFPGDDPGRHLSSWIPGVLVNKEIYLFDTRLGLPLPGPEGQEIATLRQIRNHQNPFQPLAIDNKHHYDVTAEQVKRAEINLVCSLSEAAPRMKYLESVLSQPRKISLAVDVEKLVGEFQEATRGQNSAMHFWGELGEANSPIRVLRNYFPPEEGGIDKTGRMAQGYWLLLPPNPAYKVLFRRSAAFGQQLLRAFTAPYDEFFLSPRGPREIALRGRFDEASSILAGAAPAARQEKKPPDRPMPQMQTERAPAINAPVALRFPEVLSMMLGPQGERIRREETDWLRLGVHPLNLQTLNQEELDPGTPENLEQKVAEWCDLAIDAQGQFLLAEQAFREGKLPEAELEASWKKLIRIWKVGDKLLSALFFKTNSYTMGASATYLLAQCKHERALQAQTRSRKLKHPPKDEEEKARAAWNQAATWWRKFEVEYGSAAEMPAARLRLAEALISLGDRPAALAQLQDLSGGLTNLEETGRLYQARQLEKRTSKSESQE
jgi:hypothetical protein